jgi:hypothetical protein
VSALSLFVQRHCGIYSNRKTSIQQSSHIVKGKGLPKRAEVAQGVPGRFMPRIFLTFGTTRVVGRQPYALAAFTLGEIPGTHFQRLSRPQGTWFRRYLRENSPVTDTTGNRSRYRPTSSAVHLI